MSRAKSPKLYIRKWGGDDLYSWAVFRSDHPTPVVTGCSRTEARSHMESIRQLMEERASRRGGDCE